MVCKIRALRHFGERKIGLLGSSRGPLDSSFCFFLLCFPRWLWCFMTALATFWCYSLGLVSTRPFLPVPVLQIKIGTNCGPNSNSDDCLEINLFMLINQWVMTYTAFSLFTYDELSFICPQTNTWHIAAGIWSILNEGRTTFQK